MAKAKKTKNGQWHILQYDYTDEQGKRIYKSFTAPTKAQVEYDAKKYKTTGEKREKNDKIVRDAVAEYISLHSTLARSTLIGYEKIMNTRFQSLMEMPIEKVNQDVLQRAVNDECLIITQYGRPASPKTIMNAFGLISSALKRYGIVADVRLPQRKKKIKEFAEPKEIMQAIKGTDVELPSLLAMWLSLTISEIKGIDCSAIRNGVLHIEKVRLYEGGVEIEKDTGKTEARIRNLALPCYISELINNTDTYKNYLETGENVPLITMTHTMVYKHWKKIAKEHNWDMTFHDLRAVSASVMLMLNVPDKYAMERGGWKSPHIMKTVYQQTFSKERQHCDQIIDKYFISQMEIK